MVNFFFASVIDLASIALGIYKWIIIASVIVSWVNADPYNPVTRFIYKATEPPLRFIRKNIPVVFSGIDFSPMILLMALIFLQGFLLSAQKQLAIAL